MSDISSQSLEVKFKLFTFVFPVVFHFLHEFSIRDVPVVHGVFLVLEHYVRFLWNPCSLSEHQILSKKITIQLQVLFENPHRPFSLLVHDVDQWLSSLDRVFSPNHHCWRHSDLPMVLQLVVPLKQNQLLKFFKNWSWELLLSKLWLLECDEALTLSSHATLAAAWECSWKKSVSFLSLVDWLCSDLCPSSRNN